MRKGECEGARLVRAHDSFSKAQGTGWYIVSGREGRYWLFLINSNRRFSYRVVHKLIHAERLCN
jgi:hypothetical protein